jgi:dienelactone hydrolase
MAALRVPALFLFGAEDRLIPVEKSVSVIREVLTQSYADFTIQVFDGDDHGMFRSSGALDPRYLDTMRKWLTERVRSSLNGSRRH